MYRGILRGPQNEHPESTNPDKLALPLLCIAEQPHRDPAYWGTSSLRSASKYRASCFLDVCRRSTAEGRDVRLSSDECDIFLLHEMKVEATRSKTVNFEISSTWQLSLQCKVREKINPLLVAYTKTCSLIFLKKKEFRPMVESYITISGRGNHRGCRND